MNSTRKSTPSRKSHVIQAGSLWIKVFLDAQNQINCAAFTFNNGSFQSSNPKKFTTLKGTLFDSHHYILKVSYVMDTQGRNVVSILYISTQKTTKEKSLNLATFDPISFNTSSLVSMPLNPCDTKISLNTPREYQCNIYTGPSALLLVKTTNQLYFLGPTPDSHFGHFSLTIPPQFGQISIVDIIGNHMYHIRQSEGPLMLLCASFSEQQNDSSFEDLNLDSSTTDIWNMAQELGITTSSYIMDSLKTKELKMWDTGAKKMIKNATGSKSMFEPSTAFHVACFLEVIHETGSIRLIRNNSFDFIARSCPYGEIVDSIMFLMKNYLVGTISSSEHPTASLLHLNPRGQVLEQLNLMSQVEERVLYSTETGEEAVALKHIDTSFIQLVISSDMSSSSDVNTSTLGTSTTTGGDRSLNDNDLTSLDSFVLYEAFQFMLLPSSICTLDVHATGSEELIWIEEMNVQEAQISSMELEYNEETKTMSIDHDGTMNINNGGIIVSNNGLMNNNEGIMMNSNGGAINGNENVNRVKSDDLGRWGIIHFQKKSNRAGSSINSINSNIVGNGSHVNGLKRDSEKNQFSNLKSLPSDSSLHSVVSALEGRLAASQFHIGTIESRLEEKQKMIEKSIFLLSNMTFFCRKNTPSSSFTASFINIKSLTPLITPPSENFNANGEVKGLMDVNHSDAETQKSFEAFEVICATCAYQYPLYTIQLYLKNNLENDSIIVYPILLTCSGITAESEGSIEMTIEPSKRALMTSCIDITRLSSRETEILCNCSIEYQLEKEEARKVIEVGSIVLSPITETAGAFVQSFPYACTVLIHHPKEKILESAVATVLGHYMHLNGCLYKSFGLFSSDINSTTSRDLYSNSTELYSSARQLKVSILPNSGGTVQLDIGSMESHSMLQVIRCLQQHMPAGTIVTENPLSKQCYSPVERLLKSLHKEIELILRWNDKTAARFMKQQTNTMPKDAASPTYEEEVQWKKEYMKAHEETESAWMAISFP